MGLRAIRQRVHFSSGRRFAYSRLGGLDQSRRDHRRRESSHGAIPQNRSRSLLLDHRRLGPELPLPEAKTLSSKIYHSSSWGASHDCGERSLELIGLKHNQGAGFYTRYPSAFELRSAFAGFSTRIENHPTRVGSNYVVDNCALPTRR